MMQGKGLLAYCSKGGLGLITEDFPQPVTYPNGDKDFAFVGVHLTDRIAPIGSPWSSRTPKVIGRIISDASGERIQTLVSGVQQTFHLY